MRFFRDLHGFTCLEVISATYGVMNIALFIIWPQQIANIFGSTVSSWEESAWLSTTAAFGLWGGIVTFGPLMHLIRHTRYQILVSSIWMTAFLGAMASINLEKKSEAIAFSLLGGLTIEWGDVIAAIMGQYVVSDQDLGVACCKIYPSSSHLDSQTEPSISCHLRFPHHLRLHLHRRLHRHLHQQGSRLPHSPSTASRDLRRPSFEFRIRTHGRHRHRYASCCAQRYGHEH